MLAGLVEGFVTPSGLSLAEALTIGAVLGVTYWTLVIVLGERRPGSQVHAEESDALLTDA